MNLRAWNPYIFPYANQILPVLCIAILLAVLLIWRFGSPGRRLRGISVILLLLSIFTIISATLLGRNVSESPEVNWRILWTIQEAIASRQGVYWYYIIGNILLFVPFGLFLPMALPTFRSWWRVVIAGVVFSVLIEGCQYFACIGLCELDDVLHNAMGAFYGFQIYSIFHNIYMRKNGIRILLSILFVIGTAAVFVLLLKWNRPDWTGVFY